MLQRVDQSTGLGSVVEWGPASSGVVRSAPVHTIAGTTGLGDTSVLPPQVLCSFSCALLVQTSALSAAIRICFATHPGTLGARGYDMRASSAAISPGMGSMRFVPGCGGCGVMATITCSPVTYAGKTAGPCFRCSLYGRGARDRAATCSATVAVGATATVGAADGHGTARHSMG